MNPIEKRKIELYDLLTKPRMRHKDIRLQHPLSDVKRSSSKNSAIVVPESAVNAIALFFDDANIEYHVIRESFPYPKAKSDKWMARYIEMSSCFNEYDTPALLITPFDAEALFEWTKQICKPREECDPSYIAYFNSEKEWAKLAMEAEGYGMSNAE